MKSIFNAVAVGGLVLLTGCVSGLGLDRDSATYGVRVIRPGMPEDEVNQLLGPSENRHGLAAAAQSEVIYPSGLHVRYSGAVVQSCWDERTGGRGTADGKLSEVMKPGISPAEVAEHLGKPTFGYENRSGSVVLCYAGRRVEVCYSDGRLAYWWPTDDRPPTGASTATGGSRRP